MNYIVVTPATVEPLTLEQARRHLRVEAFGTPLAHPDDDDIEMSIKTARQWCEQYTQRSFAVQTIEFALDGFPNNEIKLPLSPIATVDSVKFINSLEIEETVLSGNYYLDVYSMPNWLLLRNNNRWPSGQAGSNTVKIRVTTSSQEIPAPVKSAMKLIVGHLYENRQQDVLGNTRISFNSLPLGVESLLTPYRLGIGM